MLPKLITLSRFLADSENATPCGRTYPRRREGAEPLEDREVEEQPDVVETVEAVEKHRSNDGQARSAGVGEADGDGEEPRVRGGEGMGDSSLKFNGIVLLTAITKDSRMC